MSFLKENNLFKIVNKKLLAFVAFAVMVAISVCVFQIDNLVTTVTTPVKSLSINETSVPINDSHIPQVCNLAIQKYGNQIKNILDLLVFNNQEVINFSKTLEVALRTPDFQHLLNDKLYIKNSTLLV